MNEYRVAVPKGQIEGYSSDPNQNVSNAQGIDLDAPLTLSNVAGIGVGTVYAKKVLTATGNAIVGQLGNSQVENAIEIGTKGLTYLGIGVVSGASAIVTVPLAILTDVTVQQINNAVAYHNQNLENERIVEERGTRLNLGAGGYYG